MGTRMRARSIAVVPLVAVAAAIACGPVAPPPPPIAPINRCPDHPCAAYTRTVPQPTCNGDTCISNGQIDPILVVSLPESSFFAPTTTLAIAYSDLVNDHYNARSNQTQSCTPPGCAVLPYLAQVSGLYEVGGQVQVNVGWSLNPSQSAAAVPSHVFYRPLWPPTADGSHSEATAVGLPLDVTAAGATSVAGLPGPGDTRARGWIAALMPGSYERTIMPDPPFDSAFPPEITTSLIRSDFDDTTSHASVDENEQITVLRGLRIVRDGGDPSLDGWTVHLRDLTTKRRVSELVTLHGDGGSKAFLLNTIGFGLLHPNGKPRVQTVVAPPKASDGIPTLVNNVLVENLAEDPPVGNPLHFPALPPPALVSGMVQSPDNAPISADILITDTQDLAGNGLLLTTNPDDKAKHAIHYETRVKTSAGGQYQVSLPPGPYDVVVIPGDVSGFSITQAKLLVAGPPAPSTQAGKNFVVARRTPMIGSCVVDDGRPLAGAEVDASPAVELAGQVDSVRWPRPQRTVTDANGAFLLTLDQGTYDVIVRPSAASRLPWTIRTSLSVAEGPVELDPIVVPAPIGLDFTLRDPGNSPIVRAVVRAFAFPSKLGAAGQAPVGVGAGAGAGTAGPVAIEIGSWLTDFEGHFLMFVTPPQ